MLLVPGLHLLQSTGSEEGSRKKLVEQLEVVEVHFEVFHSLPSCKINHSVMRASYPVVHPARPETWWQSHL